MKLDDFMDSVLSCESPPLDFTPSLQALWWAKKGDWEKSHSIAQEIEDVTGYWIHAHLHRAEGDFGNAAYWYERAGKPPKKTEDLALELNDIIIFLLGN